MQIFGHEICDVGCHFKNIGHGFLVRRHVWRGHAFLFIRYEIIEIGHECTYLVMKFVVSVKNYSTLAMDVSWCVVCGVQCRSDTMMCNVTVCCGGSVLQPG